MPISYSEFKQLTGSPNYSRFIKTNLHLHTPATPWDWNGFEHQSTTASTITPKSYFEILNNTSLELVAITDHNSVLWCSELISLAKQARENGTGKIHILPGIEFSSYEGPHICAIFDEDIDISELNTLLKLLRYSGEGLQEEHITAHARIPNIIEEVEKLQGVIIAPHIQHSENGIWGNKSFSGRYTILNHPSIRICAAPSGEIKRVIEPDGRTRLLYANMDTERVTNSYGFINVGDCHRLEDFELNSTWIKMTYPCLDGIRQLKFEPELRLSHNLVNTDSGYEHSNVIEYSEPSETTHPYILGMSVKGGMLNGLSVQFSPHQNTIIGLNYAGKSALLDCIRFCLNREPTDQLLLNDFCKRIQVFVGVGGSVSMYCKDSEGSIKGISRVCGIHTEKKGVKETLTFENPSETYTLFDSEFRHDTEVHIDQLFRPELYAQGEVARVKNNVEQQMFIVNELAGINPDLIEITKSNDNGRQTLLGKLEENSSQICDLNKRISELEEEVTRIEPLRQEIADLEEFETSPLYAEKKQWAETSITIDGYKSNLESTYSNWIKSNFVPETKTEEETDEEIKVDSEEQESFDENKSTPQQYLQHANDIYTKTLVSVDENTRTNIRSLADAITSLTSVVSSLAERKEANDLKIRESTAESNEATQGDSLIEALTSKKRKLQILEGYKSELENANTKIKTLEKDRVSLLTQFSQLKKNIRKKRSEIVTTINSESMSDIQAELIPNAETSNYYRTLAKISSEISDASNKISNKEKQINFIIETVNPSELATLINGQDPNQLCQKNPNITLNTASVLFSMNLNQIHELETCFVEDSFIVSFQKEGDSFFTPISEGLSGGEQSLALISVAMIPKPIPLIIDQPEDELGPALITKNLVEQIRNVKPSRQLIFVTHVPNIPVLADSEQILYIKQNITDSEKTSCIDCCGSLDNKKIVKYLLDLDGGTVAFQKRSERYSPFL